jgi:hypothetical protein
MTKSDNDIDAMPYDYESTEYKIAVEWLRAHAVPQRTISKQYCRHDLRQAIESSVGHVSREAFDEAAKQLGYRQKVTHYNMSFIKAERNEVHFVIQDCIDRIKRIQKMTRGVKPKDIMGDKELVAAIKRQTGDLWQILKDLPIEKDLFLKECDVADMKDCLNTLQRQKVWLEIHKGAPKLRIEDWPNDLEAQSSKQTNGADGDSGSYIHAGGPTSRAWRIDLCKRWFAEFVKSPLSRGRRPHEIRVIVDIISEMVGDVAKEEFLEVATSLGYSLEHDDLMGPCISVSLNGAYGHPSEKKTLPLVPGEKWYFLGRLSDVSSSLAELYKAMEKTYADLDNCKLAAQQLDGLKACLEGKIPERISRAKCKEDLRQIEDMDGEIDDGLLQKWRQFKKLYTESLDEMRARHPYMKTEPGYRYLWLGHPGNSIYFDIASLFESEHKNLTEQEARHAINGDMK